MGTPSSDNRRDLSVVVFGVTGIAGRNVAAYLARRAEEVGATWAVAGRDVAKVERVLGEIGVSAPETIAADAGDPASLAAMAARTRVVLDLVGPYTLYGEPVVEACVANGAHYVDLTGEIPFVRQTIDAFHDRAVAAGVKVVQVSGFEALPPDLGVLLAAETCRARWGEDPAEIDLDVTTRQPRGRIGLGDVISGGTMQSMAEALGGTGAELIGDPGALVQDPTVAAEVRSRSPLSLAPRAGSLGDVIGPMAPAAFINPPVIHRTMALVAADRGVEARPFRYREGMAIPGPGATLPLRYAAAGALSATQAGLGALGRVRPAIRLRAASALRKVFPGSGFGPSGTRLEDWHWNVLVEARTDSGNRVRVDLDADGHPGYLATSRMLGEAGLMLADGDATTGMTGCLTPAAALGTADLDRFEHAGLRFSVAP